MPIDLATPRDETGAKCASIRERRQRAKENCPNINNSAV